MSADDDADLVLDGGWGWLVVLGAHSSRALSMGILFACGPFIDEWLDYFDQSAAVTTWIFSLAALVASVVTLFIGGITVKLGVRPTVIIGGVFLFSGFFFSVFAQTIEHLFVTVGVLIGVGIGMVNAPSVIVVGIYFKRRLHLAHGLVMTGVSTGQLLFATLFAHLNSTYGWRGTSLIFAAIVANVIVCGAIFTPLKKPQGKSLRRSSARTDRDEIERNCIEEEHKTKSVLCTDKTTVKVHLENTHRYNTCAEKHTSNWCIDILRRLGKATALDICLKNYVFATYQISVLCKGAASMLPMAHLVNKSVLGGNSKQDAAMLISIAGIGNLVSRATYGWLVDKGVITAHTLYLISGLFCAAETLALGLTDIYRLSAVLSFLLGVHYGIVGALAMALPRLLVTQEQVAPAVGLSVFTNQMGHVIGPVLAGWLFDVTGNYTASFAFGAAIFCLVAICVLPAHRYLSKQRKNKEDVYT